MVVVEEFFYGVFQLGCYFARNGIIPNKPRSHFKVPTNHAKYSHWIECDPNTEYNYTFVDNQCKCATNHVSRWKYLQQSDATSIRLCGSMGITFVEGQVLLLNNCKESGYCQLFFFLAQKRYWTLFSRSSGRFDYYTLMYTSINTGQDTLKAKIYKPSCTLIDAEAFKNKILIY